jgi:hypothetical protein
MADKRMLSLSQIDQMRRAGYTQLRTPDGKLVSIDAPEIAREGIDPGSQLINAGAGRNQRGEIVGLTQKPVGLSDWLGSQEAAGGAGTAAAPMAAYSPQGSYYYGQNPTISSGTGGGFTGAGTTNTAGGSKMTWNQIGQTLGLSQADITALQNKGVTPDQLESGRRQGLGIADIVARSQAATAAAAPAAASAAPADTTQPETRALQQMQQIDPASEALRQGLGQSYLSTLQGAPSPNVPTFDPTSRAPAAGDVQSYLDLYKQIDPQGYAQRQAQGQQVSDYVTRVTGQTPGSPEEALQQYAKLDPAGYAQMGQLGGAMGSYLTNAQQQAALGTSLDPQTIRELEQSTRAGQVARGNVYGTPQLVQEAMTRGQAGMQIQQQRQAALGQAGQAMQGYLTSGATPGAVGNQLYAQRQQALQSALGTQQNWLSSGQGMGDIANNLYQQGFGRNLSTYQQQLNAYQQQQAARQYAQQGALSYLGSGQTPYQAGTSYMNMAEQRAAAAAQGGPQYNPSSLGQQYQAQQLPQYGLEMSQLAGNWYNNINNANLQAYNLGQAYGGGGGNKAMSAGAGALSGAASGALAGSATGNPIGILGGAAIGAVAGGASGYFK